MTRGLFLSFFLCIVGVIQAVPTTDTTNTTTSDSLYLKAPSFTTRTLWSIVFSCVLTLFVCTTAIHVNIPGPKDNLLRTLWWRFGLGTMVMAFKTPESFVMQAMHQWRSARRVTRQFQESGYFKIPQPQEQSNSKDHGSITATTEQVDGGHGETRDLAKPFKKLLKAFVSEQSEDYTWTQTHSFFVLMGGFMLYVDGKPYHTLQPDEVLKLIRAGCIDIPNLTANQIHDKSKHNTILKALTILQVAWFVLQLMTRVIYHLEITQLEVATLAFVVLNFLTYAVLWDKPFNVQYPHPVYWKSTTESRVEDYIFDNTPCRSGISRYFDSILERLGLRGAPAPRKPKFDGRIGLRETDIKVLALAGWFMATIYGGIYCMAWFFAFSTYQEQLLCRVCAVVMTAIPSFCFVSFYIADLLELDSLAYLAGHIGMLFVMMYITVRSILFIFMLTSLDNLPPDAYKAVSWTTLVSHLCS